MGGRLRATVYLTGEDGSVKCLLAGSVPAAAEAARITNPKAWEGGVVPKHEPAPPAPPPAENPTPPVDLTKVTPYIPLEPPRSGPGSSKQRWLDYAAALGVALPEGADREGIIAAVDAHRQA